MQPGDRRRALFPLQRHGAGAGSGVAAVADCSMRFVTPPSALRHVISSVTVFSALSRPPPLRPPPPRRLVSPPLPLSPTPPSPWAAATAASLLRSARRTRSRWPRRRDRSWVHRRSRRCASARSATRKYEQHTRTRTGDGAGRAAVAGAAVLCPQPPRRGKGVNHARPLIICIELCSSFAMCSFNSAVPVRTHASAHAQRGRRKSSDAACGAAVCCCVGRTQRL